MVQDIHSRLLLLPSELKHRIAKLSSQDSLASLARTHTAYKREAEQALYRTLSSPSLKCLETLATNPEKAGFVRFLAMQYISYGNGGYGHRAINCLLNALVNMHSLSDFRLRLPIRYRRKSWKETRRSLNNILCTNDHFRLQTLYLNEGLDISRIIKSQTELQIFGIYEDCQQKFEFLGTLKQLQNAQLHLPVVISLLCYSDGEFDRITIFPAFYSIDRHPIIHQVLAESLDKDQNSYMSWLADAGRSEVSKFTLVIYLVHSGDLPSIHVLTKNMTMMFPKTTYLTFCFEIQCEIPRQEIKKIIALFPHLEGLDFELWPSWHKGDGSWQKEDRKIPEIPEHIKMALVNDWEPICPDLKSVSFIDGSNLKIGRAPGEWISH